MLDAKKILANMQEYKIKLKNKGFELDEEYFINLTNEISKNKQQCELLQSQRNSGSDKIGKLVQAKADKAEINAIKEEMTALTETIKELERFVKEKEKELRDYMLYMPNVYDDTTPIGKDDSENVVVAYYNDKPEFDFEPVEHYVLGEKMGIFDFERGAKLAGARFTVMNGAATMLEMAIKNFLLETAMENGFTPVSVPFMVNRNIAEGTGQLPKFEEDMFKTTNEGKELFLIPTAEVPVTNLFNNEILKEEMLPINYCALTPCYRVEVGSAGRDVKGIFRQHQFEKVEMVKFCASDKSWEEFDRLTASARRVLDKLGLHYREVTLCSGDLGFGACHCHDFEVWLPGQQKYREISSCSNYLDFQARRANIRYTNATTKKNEFVCTLNGSAMPIGRTMIAIMENYQQADGSILIPEALKKWLPYTKIDADGNLVK
ncbi:MAG: serine--tRNA ligase [Clostridia bacterium]|nr:serine--tRNA ligase [Clostridia bacterium]